MAIAFDAKTDDQVVNPGTSITWSHTCAAGAFLKVDTISTNAPSGVTYNGVSMTLLTSEIGRPGGGWDGFVLYTYTLLVADSGAHNIVVSFGSSSVARAASSSHSYSGTIAIDAYASGYFGSTTTEFNKALTTTQSNTWVLGAFINGVGTGVAGTATTARNNAGGGFLGEIDAEKLEEVKKRLKDVKTGTLDCEIDELGFFSEKFVKIIWVHLKGAEEVQKAIDYKLADLFGEEQRFMSHITIARVKNIKNRKEFLDKLKTISFEKMNFKINEFELMESVLGEAGPMYKLIEKYK